MYVVHKNYLSLVLTHARVRKTKKIILALKLTIKCIAIVFIIYRISTIDCSCIVHQLYRSIKVVLQVLVKSACSLLLPAVSFVLCISVTIIAIYISIIQLVHLV